MAKRRSQLRLLPKIRSRVRLSVLTKVHVQNPVHRLDGPMAADRFTKAFAAEIACANVVAHFVCLGAVVMLVSRRV